MLALQQGTNTCSVIAVNAGGNNSLEAIDGSDGLGLDGWKARQTTKRWQEVEHTAEAGGGITLVHRKSSENGRKKNVRSKAQCAVPSSPCESAGTLVRAAFLAIRQDGMDCAAVRQSKMNHVPRHPKLKGEPVKVGWGKTCGTVSG